MTSDDLTNKDSWALYERYMLEILDFSTKLREFIRLYRDHEVVWKQGKRG